MVCRFSLRCCKYKNRCRLSDVTYNQKAVSRVIWPWVRADESVGSENVHAIRVRAGLQFLVSMAAAAFLWWFFGHEVAGIVVLCLGLWILVSGLFLQKAFLTMEKYVGIFAHHVGVVLTWLLLVPFFYLCFFPGHLMIRMFRRDPLRLKLSSSEPTYWTPRAPVTDPEHFKRQF